jgi:hypothetical protein
VASSRRLARRDSAEVGAGGGAGVGAVTRRPYRSMCP